MREITLVGDRDGDGNPDLLAVQASTGALYVYARRARPSVCGADAGGTP